MTPPVPPASPPHQPVGQPGPPHPAPPSPRGPRPADLVLSVQLWVFVMLAMALSNGYATWLGSGDSKLRDAFAQFQGQARSKNQTFSLDFDQFRTFTLVIALGLVAAMVVVGVVLILLLWRGHAWARTVLDLGGAFALAQGAITVVSSHDPYLAVPAILAGVAAIGALAMMHTKESTVFLQPRRPRP